MKHFYFILTFVCLLSAGYSVSAQYRYTPYADAIKQGVPRKEAKPLKDLEKTLKDITIYSPNMSHCTSVDEFWDHIREQTPLYNEYNRKIAARNKFAVTTRNTYFRNASYAYDPDLSQFPFLIGYLSGEKDPLSGIFEVDSDDLNAYVGPYGYVGITSGLFDILETDEVIGILAHETAHYKLKHNETGYYKHKKRERSNNVLATIGAGMSAAADGFAAGMAGTSVNYDQIYLQTELYMRAAKEGALRYRYYISREKELEADIAAIRFLQFNGIDPLNYIVALEKIISYEDGLQTIYSGVRKNRWNIYDTHPSLHFRIIALYYILSKEYDIEHQN